MQQTGTCMHCDVALGGGPGGWFSLATTLERCEVSTTGFHEGDLPRWKVDPGRPLLKLDSTPWRHC